MEAEKEGKLTKRQHVAQEILDTEVSYLRSLQDCEKYYHEVLKVSKINQEQVQEVFQDFDQVIEINKLLKQRLEESSKETLECIIVQQFNKFVPFMKAYKQFVSNNENAFKIISEWEEDKNVMDMLEKCRESMPGEIQHDLRSLLIMPIQRIPRYVLLLKELKKNTTQEHPDYKMLSETLDKMSEVAKDVNESIKESERRLALFRMKKVLTNYKEFCESIAKKGEVPEKDVVQAHRFFVMEGVLTKVCRKANKERYFVLFNDIMVYGEGNKNSVQISEVFKMRSTVVEEVPDSDKQQFAFQIRNAERSFVVFCKSKEEKEKWVKNIQDQITNSKTTLGNEAKGANFIRPVFVPDSESPECALCKSKFSFVNRRHHCRKCGKCICAECSKGRMPINEGNTTQERVCKQCYEEYLATHSDKKIARLMAKKTKTGKDTVKESPREKDKEKKEGTTSTETSEVNNSEQKSTLTDENETDESEEKTKKEGKETPRDPSQEVLNANGEQAETPRESELDTIMESAEIIEDKNGEEPPTGAFVEPKHEEQKEEEPQTKEQLANARISKWNVSSKTLTRGQGRLAGHGAQSSNSSKFFRKTTEIPKVYEPENNN
ncbi:FYVE, RhoGEF and PH domain containing protein, putative [Entamoeba invadens IP1]|uniref:FYVE, RhoGEF and PH domain containing protein, putative n=1 Tax=Entamoeba invadens IP1 TaxID=370355 RepID=UPI0002C3D8D2|nr:FYVE, RhoGEF and PH domain containing protein, putative [Entamoeba invadens IP1]ELP85423.1 FYVE, RhoGEF and PH domain containing protein, putative [Entamoeba invadens IP1]|eukprot:XP_004184769.1 FYVE, RhoGEF and PH domain containing protein, putative [Entamoeba invadens IP1]